MSRIGDPVPPLIQRRGYEDKFVNQFRCKSFEGSLTFVTFSLFTAMAKMAAWLHPR
ncbi:MAG TPA: hypothetical protein VG759_21815 [Candidatus Angelobacter sp.]|nr:hypothetical protein [Candidatus Angelobacter sp.]